MNSSTTEENGRSVASLLRKANGRKPKRQFAALRITGINDPGESLIKSIAKFRNERSSTTGREWAKRRFAPTKTLNSDGLTSTSRLERCFGLQNPKTSSTTGREWAKRCFAPTSTLEFLRADQDFDAEEVLYADTERAALADPQTHPGGCINFVGHLATAYSTYEPSGAGVTNTWR